MNEMTVYDTLDDILCIVDGHSYDGKKGMPWTLIGHVRSDVLSIKALVLRDSLVGINLHGQGKTVTR